MAISEAERQRLYAESINDRQRTPLRQFFGGEPGEMPRSSEPGRPVGGQSAASLDRPSRELTHTDDPGTAQAAAASNPLGKNTNRRLCLEKHGAAIAGLSDDECAERSGLELIEARRRCSDLRSLGLIEWMVMNHGTEEKPDVKTVRRPTALGRESTVSRITDAGRAALAADR